MVLALRIEINIIAALILFMLLLSKRKKEKGMLDERLYRFLLLITLIYSLIDTVSWVIDGAQGEHMLFFLNFTNVVCYLFCIIVPYIWILYAEYRLFEDEHRLKKINCFLLPPMIIYSLIAITTPYTGWLFVFNESGVYERGPLFFVQVIMTLVYTVFPTIRAFQRLKTAKTDSERNECYIIGGFVAFPLLGLIVQIKFYGMPVAIITTVVAELMVFINVQNKQISLDALTGIYNRGQLNRYLDAQAKKDFRQKKMYLLLLDIDHFKTINDTFGHKSGDQAIIDMANILRRACGRHNNFLARYGGDEFAIVMEREFRNEIDGYINDVQSEIDDFNKSRIRQYRLSASIGYAMFGTITTQTVGQLIDVADNQMYLNKEQKRNVF